MIARLKHIKAKTKFATDRDVFPFSKVPPYTMSKPTGLSLIFSDPLPVKESVP